MIRCSLTPEEIRLAKEIASQRNANKEKNGVASRKVDSGTGEYETHLKGVLGEIVLSDVLGMEMDRTVQQGGDQGWDLRRDGVTAEVKTRIGKAKDFAMYDAHSDLEADLGILCWLQEQVVTIAGWLTRAEWLMIAEPLDFGGEKRRGVRHTNMRDPKYLKQLLNYRSQKAYSV